MKGRIAAAESHIFARENRFLGNPNDTWNILSGRFADLKLRLVRSNLLPHGDRDRGLATLPKNTSVRAKAGEEHGRDVSVSRCWAQEGLFDTVYAIVKRDVCEESSTEQDGTRRCSALPRHGLSDREYGQQESCQGGKVEG